jgi:hypothetical protein
MHAMADSVVDGSQDATAVKRVAVRLLLRSLGERKTREKKRSGCAQNREAEIIEQTPFVHQTNGTRLHVFNILLILQFQLAYPPNSLSKIVGNKLLKTMYEQSLCSSNYLHCSRP